MTARHAQHPDAIVQHYLQIRRQTEQLAEPYSEADQTVQSMVDASPVKWHLAHTTWFFETFLLKPLYPQYQPFNEQFEFLFNSYYNSIGAQFNRAHRGLISRPGKVEILQYRAYVDEAMLGLMAALPNSAIETLRLGLAHEQQHQELLVTDIQHALSLNPLEPKITEPPLPFVAPAKSQWLAIAEGLYPIGNSGEGFSFDNERPRHKQYLHPFALADRLVTNNEYLQFIQDGGYKNPLLWLSEGWAWLNREQIDSPLYWRQREGQWLQFSLAGSHLLDLHAPVRHVSYFEAAAFATWAGYRLPTEFEWEVAAAENTAIPDRLALNCLQPAAESVQQRPLQQLYNTLWQWTGSQYLAYPGFKVSDGAVGEYNGKFMSNQFVLRGGSAVTPAGHIRPTYRNFFPASARWQFTGIRMAKDD